MWTVYSDDTKEYEKLPDEQIVEPKELGNEVTWANSSYYDAYQLKPYNPDLIYQKRGNYDLFDDMREDDQISSLLTLKKIIALNAPWQIECDNDEIVEFITYALDNFLDEPFIKKMYQILSAMDYGFSITEKIYDIVNTQKFKNKIVFTKLKTRPPHTFDLYTDQKGNLDYILQHNSQGDMKVDPKKVILYSYNKEFDNPYGNSDLNKGVYRAYWSKDAIIKFWNVYNERFGMPTVVGKLPRSAGTAEKETFKKIIRNMQSKTGFTLPIDFELELLEVSKGSTEYEKAINKYDTMISRKLLVPDLMGFSGGETSGGSFALGKEQFNIFYTIIEYIRNDITQIINKEIIRPLVMWNYGTKYEAKFKFSAVDQDRKEKDLRLWLEAVKTGKVPVIDETVNWFNAQVGAPEISPEELAKIKEEKDIMAKAIQGGKDDKKDDEKDEKEIEKDEKKKDDKKPIVEEPKENTKEYAKQSEIKKIDKDLKEKDLKYAQELDKGFTLVINGLIDDIKKRNIVGSKRIESINKLKLRNMAIINRTLRSMYKDAFVYGEQTVKKNYAIDTGLDNEDIVSWFKERAFWITGVEEQNILKLSKNVVMSAIKNGDGIRETATALSKALSGYSLAEDGARLNTIVRTNTSEAFNEGRMNQFKELGDEIVGYEYDAIMDDRTTDFCREMDGRIIRPEEASALNPPNHFNCRSILQPILTDEIKEGDKVNYDKLPKGTEREKNNPGFYKIDKKEV